MIKANELRIGNLYNHNGEIREVTPSTIEEVWNSERSWVKPIQLTEEWLLKFSFEHREFSFDKGSFFLSKRKGKNEYLYQAHTNRFQVKYVHQLQNLYFSLTGRELTVA